jgi:hypothetical protein
MMIGRYGPVCWKSKLLTMTKSSKRYARIGLAGLLASMAVEPGPRPWVRGLYEPWAMITISIRVVMHFMS